MGGRAAGGEQTHRETGRGGPHPVHVDVAGGHQVLLEEGGLPGWGWGWGGGECQWESPGGQSS